MTRMSKAISVAAMLASAACPPACAADDYPTKPVRVIVGYLPGGPIDVVLRPLAQKLTESFGQPFVIENRPGANGNIGADAVAKAPPDGYTLLMATLAQLTNNPGLYPNMPFDTEKDLAPISLVATSPGAVVVHPSVPATTSGQAQFLLDRQWQRESSRRRTIQDAGEHQHVAHPLQGRRARVECSGRW